MPKVFTLYSPIQAKPLGDRKGIYQSLSSPFLSRTFLSGVKLIAISQNVKRSLIKTGFKEADITFLPPVIDTTQFNPKINRYRKREELKVAKETPLVLYCGNWAGWKGIDFLLEAMVDCTWFFTTPPRPLMNAIYLYLWKGVFVLGVGMTWLCLWTGFRSYLKIPYAWASAPACLLLGYESAALVMIFWPRWLWLVW